MLTVIVTSILIGLIFAPLGCFVLWKEYVNFGDGLAHASMLIGVIATLLGLPLIYAGLITTFLFALIVFKLKKESGNNAAIGITSSIMISIALIMSYIFPGKFNITTLLFGDIVSVTNDSLVHLTLLLLLVGGFVIIFHKQLFLTVVSRDIAGSRGIKVQLLDFIFLSILSLAILSTIKIVGALLVTSIVLIPAMIARLMAISPIHMIGLSAVFSIIMNCLGMIISFYADMPLAPVIILSGGIIYLLLLVVKRTGR